MPGKKTGIFFITLIQKVNPSKFENDSKWPNLRATVKNLNYLQEKGARSLKMPIFKKIDMSFHR